MLRYLNNPLKQLMNLCQWAKNLAPDQLNSCIVIVIYTEIESQAPNQHRYIEYVQCPHLVYLQKETKVEQAETQSICSLIMIKRALLLTILANKIELLYFYFSGKKLQYLLSWYDFLLATKSVRHLGWMRFRCNIIYGGI